MKVMRLKKLLAGLVVTTMSLSFLGIPAHAKTITNKDQKKVVGQSSKKDLKRKIIGYFPEWAYKSEVQGYFNVTDLQWDSLTHIQYSFGLVDPSTNKIKLGDKYSALEEDFANYDLSYKGKKIDLDPTLPYKGHFNVLQTMKKDYPNVKLLMSVGGWAGSRGFYTMLDTDEGIDTFADSCVDFIRKYNFDGIDIDFEYPSSTSESGNPADFDLSEPRRSNLNERYNILMKTLREKIDEASEKYNKDYILSAAVTASPWVLGGINDNTYAKYLDFLSVMSYDYHGGWNEYVENLAGIYPDQEDRETASQIMPTLCMDWAYRFYRGVLPSEKIIMGIPYYTRGWENVQGGQDGLHGSSRTPASGKYNIWGDDLDNDGELEPAGANPLWHVLNLMEQDPNLKVYWDDVEKVPHVWQSKESVFLSFENEKSIDERVKYIKNKNLGGALIWVMNGDYGLNPNYVEGSNKINEGKYTFGDTLTKLLSSGLKNIGSCKETDDDSTSSLEPVNVEVSLDGKYDHPNYTYDIKIKNCTDKKIDGGWDVSFDLPKSALYKSSWGGTYSLKDNGDFKTVIIKSGDWQSIEPGATVTIQGMIGLCFSGVRNITFNGMNPIGPSMDKVKEVEIDELRNVIEEVPKEIIEELPKKIIEELPKEIISDESTIKEELKEMEEDKSKEKLIDSTEELPKDTTMDKGVIEDNLKDELIDNSEKEIKNNLKETIENN
ncbi:MULTISPECIES: glycosyl hydrolase family 18 protein [Clostridium]|uniref:glycosyl hydrolase family 18 protein n=1 Tax=Clostridium TaxID=1485 RepID=UPI000CF5FE4B|nr:MULTISPECIES: glycosyl hydrolase family 18 protein [Clostridium]NFT05733.1 chitinase [Clostridium botulinum]